MRIQAAFEADAQLTEAGKPGMGPLHHPTMSPQAPAGFHASSRDAANAPWGWDDKDDAPGRGALATDPAGLVMNYFRIPEAVSAAYTYNPYR